MIWYSFEIVKLSISIFPKRHKLWFIPILTFETILWKLENWKNWSIWIAHDVSYKLILVHSIAILLCMFFACSLHVLSISQTKFDTASKFQMGNIFDAVWIVIHFNDYVIINSFLWICQHHFCELWADDAKKFANP